MGCKVNFIIINKGSNAEPNSPMPTIRIEGRTVILSFYLNAFIYDDYEEDDIGILEFYNCRQYRIGSPNEDGFYIYNQSRYKKYGIRWGEFYLVQNSDWQDNFPQPIYIDASLKKDILNHYLFYFKDETFECVSETYSFKVKKNNIQL